MFELDLAEKKACSEEKFTMVFGVIGLELVADSRGNTFVTFSLAAMANISHICAKFAGSLEAFSVYMASKSHRKDGW